MSNQQPYQAQYQPPYQAPNQAPRVILKADFSLWKTFFLSIITLGIYGLIVWIRVVKNINVLASPYDGKKTMGYIPMILLGIITFGIYPLVWNHQLCDRIGDELRRRRFQSDFSSSTFWLWGVLGSLIIVGPFIFQHKLFESMNMLTEHHNMYG